MFWNSFIRVLRSIGQDLEDPANWRVSLNGKRGLASLNKIQLADGKVQFEVQRSNEQTVVSISPTTEGYAVKIGDQPVPKAKVIFSLKHQILRPLILVIEVRNAQTPTSEISNYRFETP
ncbi:MAG: hypothetical protein J0L72_10130 [Armatimonadetes bacterium]|nr:hypothetical protein [Armatimonadota bacterium]